MKLFCRLFGHQPPVYAKKKGWWSPGEEYGRLHGGPVDGIGREHGHITAKCARCGEQFTVARVHLIKREAEKALERELEETMLEVESWKLAKQAAEQNAKAGEKDSALHPCPECETTRHLKAESVPLQWGGWVCTRCGFRAPSGSTRSIATRRWNDKAQEAQRRGEL